MGRHFQVALGGLSLRSPGALNETRFIYIHEIEQNKTVHCLDIKCSINAICLLVE